MSRGEEAAFFTYPEMTAPASGQSTLVQLYPKLKTQNYTLFATVASINTNVVIALNGSIDGTNWSKIIDNQTITGNGTNHYNVANHPVKYVQPVFVSESGGTSATVLFSVGADG
jgi:hypothetical protein